MVAGLGGVQDGQCLWGNWSRRMMLVCGRPWAGHCLWAILTEQSAACHRKMGQWNVCLLSIVGWNLHRRSMEKDACALNLSTPNRHACGNSGPTPPAADPQTSACRASASHALSPTLSPDGGFESWEATVSGGLLVTNGQSSRRTRLQQTKLVYPYGRSRRSVGRKQKCLHHSASKWHINNGSEVSCKSEGMDFA